MSDLASAYESRQDFNWITRWLHSRRYAMSISVVAQLADETHEPIRVLEIGCGQGKLFEQLHQRFDIRYTGIDAETAYIQAARARYGHLTNFRAETRVAQDVEFLRTVKRPDVVFALETFEHIYERDVVRLIEIIAQLKPKLFVCSVPVEIGPAILVKNVGSWLVGYTRHREYSWKETLAAACYQLDSLPRHRRSHKGFDWRWLAQTIRHNFRSVERRHLPFNLLPAPFSASMYFIASRPSNSRSVLVP